MKKTLTDGITVEITDEKYAEMEKNQDTLVCAYAKGTDASVWILGTEGKTLLMLAELFLDRLKNGSKDAADAAFNHILAGLYLVMAKKEQKREMEGKDND